MGDAELGIGADQRFIEHLLLFIVHVRDQQGEEDHQLLDLAGQHRVQLTVIQLVDELHLRGDGLPDLHDVDAVRGAGRDPDKLAAYLTADKAKLMAFDRRHDKALNPAHTHTQGEKLHGKGLSGAGGPENIEICVLIFSSC